MRLAIILATFALATSVNAYDVVEVPLGESWYEFNWNSYWNQSDGGTTEITDQDSGHQEADPALDPAVTTATLGPVVHLSNITKLFGTNDSGKLAISELKTANKFFQDFSDWTRVRAIAWATGVVMEKSANPVVTPSFTSGTSSISANSKTINAHVGNASGVWPALVETKAMFVIPNPDDYTGNVFYYGGSATVSVNQTVQHTVEVFWDGDHFTRRLDSDSSTDTDIGTNIGTYWHVFDDIYIDDVADDIDCFASATVTLEDPILKANCDSDLKVQAECWARQSYQTDP